VGAGVGARLSRPRIAARSAKVAADFQVGSTSRQVTHRQRLNRGAVETVLGIYTASAVEVALLTADREELATSSGGALESLLRLIERVIAEAKTSIANLTLIGVCTGPGSFTGLRIGVAFAKTLAQARDLPIVGISAYDVAAFGVTSYPLVTVARGKPGYYYARIDTGGGAEPSYLQGDRATIEQASARFSPPAQIAGPDFCEQQPGHAALAVATLARAAFRVKPDSLWPAVEIDYGQRPNAVINWERRHAPPTGGRKV
jgi:tRNA threonylcarbamoyladenosine biosynthesis protein TsaB